MTESETQDLASNLDVPVKTVREMEQRMTSTDVAFDGADSDDDEFVTSPSGSDNNRDALYNAIADLDERSKDILQRRWLSDSKATLHELAAEYNVSAERIRQIEKRAMQKMKGQLSD